MRRRHGMFLAILLLGSTGMSNATTPPASAPLMQCTDAEHRQFDFWIGEWQVHGGPDGAKYVGDSRIERSANGCWLVEHWRGSGGNHGTSVNAWDAAHGVWRQFWVGGDGVVLRLEGGLQDGAMVMTGELPAAKGGTQQQRIRWTPQADGSLVQQWETSDDDGATWATSFRGHYRRKGGD